MMIKIDDLKDGQPIKVLETLYCVDIEHNEGFLLKDVTGCGDKEINLYMTGKEFLENINRVAIKYQVGEWNLEFNRIDFKDNSGISYFIVHLDLEILPEEIFELCSRLELHNWYKENVDSFKDFKGEKE